MRGCLPCQTSTQQKHTELLMTELPKGPWQRVLIDFSGPYPSHDYCILVVDNYTRYPVVEIVRTTSAAAVIPKLDEVFALFGSPEECRTDNGPPFQGEEFADTERLLCYPQKQTVN